MTLAEGVKYYTGTLTRSVLNAALSALVGAEVFAHVDDGVAYHASKGFTVRAARRFP